MTWPIHQTKSAFAPDRSKLYYSLVSGNTKLRINRNDITKTKEKPQDSLHNKKWFEICIVQRILATNIVLSCINENEHNACTFCEDTKDSLHRLGYVWNM